MINASRRPREEWSLQREAKPFTAISLGVFLQKILYRTLYPTH